MWKFSNFFATQILAEINFSESKLSQNVTFLISETSKSISRKNLKSRKILKFPHCEIVCLFSFAQIVYKLDKGEK